MAVLKSLGFSALILLAISPAWAAEPGQADLDRALAAKLTADDPDDLGQVIELCQSALDRGLDEQSTEFAKKLLASTLLQRASLIEEAILQSPPSDARSLQQFLRLRQVAVADLERALRHDPLVPEIHYLLGRLYAMPGGDRARARAALDEAIRLEGDDVSVRVKALVLRASLHVDPQRRLADFNEALKIAPTSAEALRARGTLYLEQGKHDEGIADLDRALKLEPDHAGTHELRGVALAAAGKYDEALESLGRAIELEPAAPVPYLQRARVHLLQDNAQAAVADLDKALAEELPNPAVLLLRAGAHQRLGNSEQALADVETTLKLRPGFVPGLRARAAVRAEAGEFEEAIADLKQVQQAQPRDGDTLAQLATLYAACKRFPEAIETFAQALEADPENVLAYVGRADTYLRIGKQAEAVSDYEAALKREPKNTHVLNNLAWLLATSPEEKLRDGRRAIELAEEGCKLTDYKQAHLLSTLAAAYAETGDFEKAIEWSSKAVALGGEAQPQLARELDSYKARQPWREQQNEEPAPPAAQTATRPERK